jgi:glycosyltransferase involved in cell wall biosynthesis
VARLIRAFAQWGDCQEVDLILAGPTDARYTPQLLALATALGVGNTVKCLDYVSYDQLRDLYRQAIALVFPSLWEGFGFPVLEAMACGAAVITSNQSSLPEVAGDGALLVNPLDVSALAQAMQQVWQDSGLRTALQQRGLARSGQFSWQKTGQMTGDLLAKFL